MLTRQRVTYERFDVEMLSHVMLYPKVSRQDFLKILEITNGKVLE